MTSKYAEIWKELEKSQSRPSRCTKIIEIDYDDFENQVLEEKTNFAEDLVTSIYGGGLYILRNCLNKDFIKDVKAKTMKFWAENPQSFHKILEDCPDFHRILDQEVSKNYSFKSIRHSTYFFPWNKDPLKIREAVMKRWRIMKYIQGYRKDEWEYNTPKDGIVDRTQVAMYPTGIGCSEMHSDPVEHQKLFISIYMSKRGIDFEQGGFYVIDDKDQVKDCEGIVEVGDLAFGYASVVHGVATVDPHKPCDWNSDAGRWWIGLYSISSNEMHESKRATGRPVEIATRQ